MSSHFERIQRVLADATPLQLSLVGAAVLSAGYILLNRSNSRKYPPGPPRLPLIGNSHNFPNENWPVVFNEWQKQYGDIVYLELPGMPFVVVNSLSLANELFIRRTNINSGRKIGYMVNHMMGWEWIISHRNTDNVFYKQRKVLKHGLGPTAVMRHDVLIERCASSLALKLQKIHGSPEDTIVKSVALAIIELAYGQKMVEESGEQMIKQNQEAMSMLFHAFHHVWMVDFFPWLRFIPSWMPGAGFKRFAKKTKNMINTIRSAPFNLAVQRHSEGKLDHCLADEWITEFGPCEEAQDALAALYFAGYDTTSTVVVRFLHAMFIFPDVAKRVQAEIDSVVGQGHLLTIKDRQSLPYTEAVWKETLRWRPQLPLALPHTNSEDQIINGYFIPKGALFQPNYGFMMTDPSIWGDPDVFRPERFLDSDASTLPDPNVLVFGFGSRICPGMYFADRAAFHVALTSVSLFSILPLEGEKVPHIDDIEYTKDVTKVPVKFDCRFVPRNEEASNLLASLALNASK
ncbi:O-methylsterigmatocystin oxidoreductase Short=OMST oxidoreductase; AltName: Full=Aflatoxin B synthase; AltName: Full=Aflatoxin biosynthesis protein Q; AltName: Full=Cytochrome P450 64 [Serendipita indica DSM 11827]|nr:O-methylsterigmatocystin oxidoreductase Short=OMST oxidoreductase; AltName: Full=Aflatoxin B synthase; AltName: Full=Aflatoxin biosynthesis protein Q; AltName: Full=Cytochrome P450 64 [Serendipita indica DSM 11827]